jgi:hypothetical protein
VKRILVLLACLALVATLSAGPASAATPPTGVPVPNSPLWWEYSARTADAEVVGDTAPPGWGSRSLLMTTGAGSGPSGGGRTVVSTVLGPVPNLTSITDFDTLVYWTFVEPTSAHLDNAPTLQIATDLNGDLLWDTNLVFSPKLNGGAIPGVWQRWSTRTGLWYSSKPIPTPTDPTFASPANPKPLDDIEAAYRFAAVAVTMADPLGWIRIVHGSPLGDQARDIARVDGVVIKSEWLPVGVATNFEGFLGTGLPSAPDPA